MTNEYIFEVADTTDRDEAHYTSSCCSRR